MGAIVGTIVRDLREEERRATVHGQASDVRSRALERQVVAHRLDDVLAVVEHALDGDVVDVGVLQAEHLRLLERAHAAVRAQHEHAHALLAAHRVLGRAAGVAAGRTQDVERLDLAHAADGGRGDIAAHQRLGCRRGVLVASHLQDVGEVRERVATPFLMLTTGTRLALQQQIFKIGNKILAALHLGADQAEALARLARAEGATLFMVALAAFDALKEDGGGVDARHDAKPAQQGRHGSCHGW